MHYLWMREKNTALELELVCDEVHVSRSRKPPRKDICSAREHIGLSFIELTQKSQ